MDRLSWEAFASFVTLANIDSKQQQQPTNSVEAAKERFAAMAHLRRKANAKR
jgi:hypothetical protein